MDLNPSKANFLNWLASKSPQDYWHYPHAPRNFALKMQAHLKMQLEKECLPCEHVVWHLTNRCNLRCGHCGVSGGEKKYVDITGRQFLKHLPRLQALGLKALTLSGGEPFLVSDIFDVIAYCRTHHIKVAAVTNGHFLARDAQRLQRTPVDSISISIDGCEENHNRLRRSKRSYTLAIEALKIARDIDIPIVNVNTSVFPENLDDLPHLREIVFKTGAHHWVLRPVALSGRATESCLRLKNAELLKLLRFAETSVREGYDVTVEGLGYLGALDSILSLTPFVSYTGWNGFYVLPNGDIKGFNEEHHPVEGNLLTSDLKHLWFSCFKTYRYPERPKQCKACTYWDACGGGNIAEADTGWRCIQDILPLLDTGQS